MPDDISFTYRDGRPELTIDGMRYICRPMAEEPLPRTPIAFSQRNPHWAHIPLGSSSYTIGTAGCAVVAAAMLGTLYEPALTPDILAIRLNATGGFTSNGLLIWAKVAEAVDGLEFVSYHRWRDGPANVAQVRDALSQGPQIIQVDFKPTTSAPDMHFVLGLGMTEDGDDIDIIDPWTGYRGTLLNVYGKPGWDLARAVYAMAEFRV